jgi:hypothetical protein
MKRQGVEGQEHKGIKGLFFDKIETLLILLLDFGHLRLDKSNQIIDGESA